MHSSSGILRGTGLIIGGFFALFSTLVQSGSAVTPGSKAAGMDACVAPTGEIRRNHMDYLKHDRIKVVQQGVRDVKHSLAECIACHAEPDAVKGGYQPVNGEGQFCNGCHQYVAVSLTCFQCHSKTPETGRPGYIPTTGNAHEGPKSTSDQRIEPGGRGGPLMEELAQLHELSREE